MSGPIARLQSLRPYAPPAHPAPVTLKLDANEGLPPDAALLAEATAGIEASRYPDAKSLESAIAVRLGCQPESVLLTAGGDEAIDRLCRAYLEPGRTLLTHTPSFEMIARYAHLAGARVREVPWERGPFPIEQAVACIDGSTAIIAVVTPNNPTGCVATAKNLTTLSAAAPNAVLVVDLAYTEFAERDLMPLVLALPNAVAVRTFSKAWGLAGLRVGFAAGAPTLVAPLRAAGGPYSVSRYSIAVAALAFERAPATADVRARREELRATLTNLGVDAPPSEGNFVFLRSPRVDWIRDALAGLGIAVRAFPGRQNLADSLRITIPPRAEDQPRLLHAVRSALKPDAIVFDMDGVLADVSKSYRRAIVETAATWNVDLSAADVALAKAQGNANNDWVLTQRLLAQRGVTASLGEVTARFEEIYQGTADSLGLREAESLLCSPALLAELSACLPLAIATGRPRADAVRFLERYRLASFFRAIVCMEDGPPKPAPFPVAEAMRLLDAQYGWMIGDTRDDIVAAREARAVPIGIAAPGDDPLAAAALLGAAGAARTIRSLDELKGLLST